MLPGTLRSWTWSIVMVLLMAASVQAQATRPGARGDKPAGARAEEAAAPRAAIDDKDDKEARDLFKLGKQAFDEGRFERALKYFNDAYELSHRAALLSNIGTVLDRLRRDREALDAYRSYLAQVPDAPNRAQIEERVRIIEGVLQKSGPEEPSAVAATDTPSPVPTPAQTAEAQVSREQASQAAGAPPKDADSGGKAVTSRWWFWAGLGGVAVAAVVVGVAASSGGGIATESPALLGSATRVREL